MMMPIKNEFPISIVSAVTLTSLAMTEPPPASTPVSTTPFSKSALLKPFDELIIVSLTVGFEEADDDVEENQNEGW